MGRGLNSCNDGWVILAELNSSIFPYPLRFNIMAVWRPVSPSLTITIYNIYIYKNKRESESLADCHPWRTGYFYTHIATPPRFRP